MKMDAVPDAGVYLILARTDENDQYQRDGYAELTATKGMYPIGAYKDGYLPVKKEVQITEKQTTEVSLTLVKKDIIVGDLTVRRMTLEETRQLEFQVTRKPIRMSSSLKRRCITKEKKSRWKVPIVVWPVALGR